MKIINLFAALMAATLPLFVVAACGGEEPTPPTPDSGVIDPPPPNPDSGPMNPSVCGIDNPCNEGYACMDTVCTQNAAVACDGFDWLVENPDGSTKTDLEFLCEVAGAPRKLTYRVQVLAEDPLGTCVVNDNGGQMRGSYRFAPNGQVGQTTDPMGSGQMELIPASDTFQIRVPPRTGIPEEVLWICSR